MEGDVETGTIDAGELDMWSFHAHEGEWVTLQLTKLTGSSSFSPSVVVYSADGFKVIEGPPYAGAPISFRASSTGIYTVVIWDKDPYDTGTYQLEPTGMTPAAFYFSQQRPIPGVMRLTWPSPSHGWVLEESATMQPGSWAESGLAPSDNGLDKSVEVDLQSGGRMFYRMSNP